MHLMQLRKETLKKVWQARCWFKAWPFLYQCSLLHLQPLLVPSHSAPLHTWLLRVKPHSFPTVIQLEFSFHFLEGVRAIFMVRWLLQYVPHVWMTEKSQSSHENKQSTIVTVVFCCCNKVTQVLFKIYEISSSSNQVEQMKNENGRFGDPLVQYAGESPMTPTMSTALKTSSSIGPNVL